MSSSDENCERNSSTRLRTFRLTQNLVWSLQSEARSRAVSVNALVSAILLKFIGWDRFADRFRFVALTSDLLQVMLASVSDEEVAKAADTIGTHVAAEGIKFWPTESRLDGFVTYLNNRCRYAGYGKMSYETEGKQHILTIEH